MQDISVTFLHPTSGEMLCAVVVDGMTAEAAINHLRDSQFLLSVSIDYSLCVKGGRQLPDRETFAAG